MFAIVQTGGKQYKVEKGTTLDVERIDSKEGSSVNLDQILLISDKTATKIGTPIVEGAYAVAKIVAHKKDDKLLVYKMKAKKRYRKTQGHRQRLTTIEITDIKASGGKKTAAEIVEPKTEKAVEKPAAKTTKAPKKTTAKKAPAKKKAE